MHRTRTIAGTPVRSAAQAWSVVKTLLSDTLERSSEVPAGSVSTALTPLDGLAASIAAAGATADTPLTLIAGDLHLDLYIVRGDDAFTVEENLSPVPGGASSPRDWTLYVQPPPHLLDAVTAATDDTPHLTVGRPPTAEAKSLHAAVTRPAITIDEAALRRQGEDR